MIRLERVPAQSGFWHRERLQVVRTFPITPFDRHRGGGHPPTPATPPCVRVRTRRFESVTLTVLEQ
jgi:hypothetical protein